MVDPVSIGVAALIAAKAAAGKLGEHLGDEAGSALDRIVMSVRRRLHGNATAERALQRVDDNPADRAGVSELAATLDQVIRADEAFRADLIELVRSAQRDPGIPRLLLNVSGSAEVGKIVTIGEVHGDVSF